jgi:mono/diheme cytochrome c family protein
VVEGRERRRRNVNEWSALGWGILAGIVVLGLLVGAYGLGQRRGEAKRTVTVVATAGAATQTTTEGGGGAQAGLVLFRSTCGGCHTLAAAGTSGAVGPNLDDLRPSEATVLAAIQNGGAGTGQMPANLLQGAQARQVAAAVAGAAGK